MNIQIREIKTTTRGDRLKKLIKDKNMSQKKFVENTESNKSDFVKWLEEKRKNGFYLGCGVPTEKDISRWVNNKVNMSKRYIEIFADYFGVDCGYLECTQVLEHEKDCEVEQEYFTQKEREQILENENKLNGLNAFLDYYEMYILPEKKENDSITAEIICKNENENKYTIYEITKDINIETLTYTAMRMNKEFVEITKEQLDQIMNEVAKYTDYLIMRIQDNSGHKD